MYDCVYVLPYMIFNKHITSLLGTEVELKSESNEQSKS